MPADFRSVGFEPPVWRQLVYVPDRSLSEFLAVPASWADVDSEDSLVNSMTDSMRIDLRKTGMNARVCAEFNYAWETTFARLFSVYDSASMNDTKGAMPNLQALPMG